EGYSVSIVYCLFLTESDDNHGRDGTEYIIGIFANIDARNLHFPKCEIIIYHDDSIPIEFLQAYESCSNVTCIEIRDERTKLKRGHVGFFLAMARYKAILELQSDVILFRDADLELTRLDAECVGKWLSNKTHPIHRYFDSDTNWPLTGGAFGVRLNSISKTDFQSIYDGFIDKELKCQNPDLKHLTEALHIEQQRTPFTYYVDQRFLYKVVEEMFNNALEKFALTHQVSFEPQPGKLSFNEVHNIVIPQKISTFRNYIVKKYKWITSEHRTRILNNKKLNL
ncbi:VPS-53, partial [Acrasis kona]